MYKGEDKKTLPLFEELFPFGGKLDKNNRWLKIAGLIPWDEIEDSYRKHFSVIGRPALDSRLAIGVMILKHITGLSDEEMVLELSENPYLQAFCGFENFQTEKIFDSSSLSKLRKRLGAKYFKELEDLTYDVLIEKKIIKRKGLLVDATVFPEKIKYPTDVGLLNEAREWLVKKIKNVGAKVGRSFRTYPRAARKAYLRFSKNKKRTKKKVAKAKKAMLQYVRRNIKQFEEVLAAAAEQGLKIEDKIIERFAVIGKFYAQQLLMYKEKISRVPDRIVSLSRAWVRPMVRGKTGKQVEFGPKAALSYVDGFVFLDHLDHDNFSEGGLAKKQLGNYKERFGKKPPYMIGDQTYGNRNNRGLLKSEEIRDAFEPLGRKVRQKTPRDRWRKQKQRERNRIEGLIGHAKEHFELEKIRYYIDDGAEIWARMGLLGMNLKTAIKRI